MNRSLSRRRRGFTLIEVLLVLVILVLLAAMSVPLYSQIQKRANNNAAKSQIGILKTSLDGFQVDILSYPTTQQGLAALQSPPPDLPDPSRWAGYLEKVPVDPWGREFQYRCPGSRNPQSYDLWSIGADGADGTEDDIGNW